jgi:hypothetical protein
VTTPAWRSNALACRPGLFAAAARGRGPADAGAAARAAGGWQIRARSYPGLLSFRAYKTDTCNNAQMNTYRAVLAPEFGVGNWAIECSRDGLVWGLMFRGYETEAQVQLRVCALARIELQG